LDTDLSSAVCSAGAVSDTPTRNPHRTAEQQNSRTAIYHISYIIAQQHSSTAAQQSRTDTEHTSKDTHRMDDFKFIDDTFQTGIDSVVASDEDALRLPDVVNFVALRETCLSEAPFVSRSNRKFWKKWMDSRYVCVCV
jgi:hypothetical protein